MSKSFFWCFLYNCIVAICWTVIAIVFHKWWLALFAALFMNSISYQTAANHFRVCDKCGRRSEYAESYNAAIEKAKQHGWIRKLESGEWKDYCPDCRNEED